MCGRYTIIRGNKILDTIFNVTVQADLHLVPRWNVAPTQSVPAILNTAARDVRMLRWGLIPSWAKDAKIGNSLINARAETLAEKPAFRTALNHRRCLLPADGFYEWQKNSNGSKTPMFIRMKEDAPFAFAGLWDEWRDPTGAILQSCTIITTTPNALMAPIHDRMPVIVQPEGYLEWLRPDAIEPTDAAAWLNPFPADQMKAYPVGPKVNSPKNKGPELVQEVALPRDDPGLFG